MGVEEIMTDPCFQGRAVTALGGCDDLDPSSPRSNRVSLTTFFQVSVQYSNQNPLACLYAHPAISISKVHPE